MSHNSAKAGNNPPVKTPYIHYNVDRFNSVFVLVIYYHANPRRGKCYYSKFVTKEKAMEEQLDSMISLIIRKQLEGRTMILYQNHKRGTGKESDLPENEELIRIHHGRTLDFSSSVLDQPSQQYLRERLQPLQQ